jgi:hypothetical protein
MAAAAPDVSLQCADSSRTRLHASTPDAADIPANGGAHNARIKLVPELFELGFVDD